MSDNCIYCNDTGFIVSETLFCPKCDNRIDGFKKYDIKDDILSDFRVKATCNNCGFSIDAHFSNIESEDITTPCSCYKTKVIKRDYKIKMIDSHIHNKYWNKSLDTLINVKYSPKLREQNKNSIDTLQKVINEINISRTSYRSYWLYSKSPGSGISTSAVLIAEAFLNKGKKVRFISMSNLIETLMNFKDKDVKSNFLSDMKKYDVFLIDDAFNIERCMISSNLAMVTLFNFFKENFDDDKIFICTSNRKIDDPDLMKEHHSIVSILLRGFVSIEFFGDLYNYGRSNG